VKGVGAAIGGVSGFFSFCMGGLVIARGL